MMKKRQLLNQKVRNYKFVLKNLQYFQVEQVFSSLQLNI